MAAAVFTNTPAPYCNRIENFDRATLLRLGMASGFAPTAAEEALGITQDSIRDQCLQLGAKGYVEFEYSMSADTTTAGVINLTDGLLVDFLTTSRSRRVDWEALVKADVDAALIKRSALVAMAATPIAYSLIERLTADGAAVTSIAAFGAGDLISTAAVVPTAALSVSSNDVILTLTGVTDIDTRWVVNLKVYPAKSHTLIATT